MSSYRWISVTPKAAFAPRDGAGALVYDGKMWLLGGWNKGVPQDTVHFPLICNNEVWCSTDGADWTLVKPNTFAPQGYDPQREWSGRHCSGYVVHGGRMWIVGCDANQGYYKEDVWTSTNGRTWQQVNKGREAPWGPRILFYTVLFQNRIWVMGGQTTPQYAPAEERFYNDVWVSPDGIEWEHITPREPKWPPRGLIGGTAVFKDRIWLLGGGTYNTPAVPERKFFNDVWSTTDGIDWTCHLEHAPWSPREFHEVAVFDDKLWVMEGWNQSNRNDVWYSSDGVTWHELPGTPWKPRHAASVFVYDDALWMVAGNNMESDVWKLVRA